MALPTRARSARLVVVALVAVSLLTITVDYREGDNGPLASLGRIALTVMSPLQEVVSKVTHPIGNFFSTLVRLPAIRRENEDLKDRLAQAEKAGHRGHGRATPSRAGRAAQGDPEPRSP